MAGRVRARGLMQHGRSRYCLLLGLILLAAAPALAQSDPPPAATAPARSPLAPPPSSGPAPQLAPEPEKKPAADVPLTEEIEIIAPRRDQSQIFDEFQRAEFERIRGRFEKPPPPAARGNEMFDASVGASSPTSQDPAVRAIREAKPIRDLLDKPPGR
jgi:hypothetical protein